MSLNEISLNADGSKVTGAQLFYEILDSFDVRDVTGYSGGNVLPLIDAFANPPKSFYGEQQLPIAVHMHANEACAGHSATAIARSSNHIGVCIVTSGPGITNCVTPMKDAFADGAPVLFISGQVAQLAMGKEAFQEVDAVSVITPVAKWSHLVTKIEKLAWTINRAMKVMLEGRPGPVHLDVPKDILNAPIPAEFDPFIMRRRNRPENATDNPMACLNSRKYVAQHLGTKISDNHGGIRCLDASREHARSSARLKASTSHLLMSSMKSKENLNCSSCLNIYPDRSEGSAFAPSFEVPESGDLLNDLIKGPGFPVLSDAEYDAPSTKDVSFAGCPPDIMLNIPKIVALLKVAKKPLIHVGNGARSASGLIRALVDHLDVPVTCTMHGLGVVSAFDDRFLHWIGMHGSIYANKAIMDCDLLINFGARFDDRSIGSVDTFACKARLAAREMRGGIVHIDICAESFGKSGVISHLTVRADCGIVASQLLASTPRMFHYDWIQQCMKWKKQYPLKMPAGNTLYGPHIVDAVNRWCKKTDSHEQVIVTTGVGNHQMYACQYFDYVNPNQLISSGGLGTMGVGLPFAIGMAIANPKDIIVNFDGDGSFNMSSNDLSTLMRYQDRRVKIFIFNDTHLSMVAMWQEFFMDGREFITTNTNPDYVKLADAHSIKAIVVDSLDTIDERVAEAMEHMGPVIVDCRVEKSHVFPMAIPGTSLSDQYHDLEHMRAAGGCVGPNISPG